MGTTRLAPRALVLDDLRVGTGWRRNARVATLISLVLGGVLVLLQLAHTLAIYGPGSLLDWLLPRL